MHVQQISVFLENKAGRLADVAAALKEKSVNVRALTIAESSEYGVLRMIVNRPDDAAAALREAKFTVKQNPVIAVEVDDHEGGMYGIMKLCDEAGANVEYMYSFVEQTTGKAILFIRFEDTEKAERLFLEGGYRMLSTEEVCKI